HRALSEHKTLSISWSHYLNSKDSSISIALQQIQPESWQAIWDAEIAPQMEALIKKPGYSMNA
ncbi:tautomerase PptA, partial [Escherichia coli]|nr:tautomerase PptA [Escherichia coli]